MSEDPTYDTNPSGGGRTKWLLGAAAAIVLLGGGYLAWTNLSPTQSMTQMAYEEDATSAEPLRGPVAFEDESATERAEPGGAAPAASPEARAPARRTPVRAAEAAEATIGVTPETASLDDSNEIIVDAPRRPVWSRTPSLRRLSALYPERALARGREGEARLACIVEAGGALECDRVSETPGGFGAAALRVARTFRHAPQRDDGSDAVGAPVNLRVVFRIEDEPRRWRS